MLNAQFALKQFGKLEYFLGIKVEHLKDGFLFISQTKYIKDLLVEAKMINIKGMPTPMIFFLIGGNYIKRELKGDFTLTKAGKSTTQHN